MQNEEENIRKKLQGKTPDKGFKLPKNYFDTFSAKVKEQIEAEHSTHKQNVWSKVMRPAYAIPLVALLLVVAGYFIFTPSPKAPSTQIAEQPTSIDELSTLAISEYLAQEVDLIGVDGTVEKELVLLAYSPEEAITETAPPTYSPALTDGNEDTIPLSDSEIEEYLLETAEDYLIESL